MTWLLVVLGGGWAFLALVTWALCRAAGRSEALSDREAWRELYPDAPVLAYPPKRGSGGQQA